MFVFAEQLAFVPPLVPLQVQFHWAVPVTVDAVPVVQRFVVGAVPCACPLLPQAPLIISGETAIALYGAPSTPHIATSIIEYKGVRPTHLKNRFSQAINLIFPQSGILSDLIIQFAIPLKGQLLGHHI
jgi:hypothetical protein